MVLDAALEEALARVGAVPEVTLIRIAEISPGYQDGGGQHLMQTSMHLRCPTLITDLHILLILQYHITLIMLRERPQSLK